MCHSQGIACVYIYIIYILYIIYICVCACVRVCACARVYLYMYIEYHLSLSPLSLSLSLSLSLFLSLPPQPSRGCLKIHPRRREESCSDRPSARPFDNDNRELSQIEEMKINLGSEEGERR